MCALFTGNAGHGKHLPFPWIDCYRDMRRPLYRVTPDAVRTATSRWLDILASDVDLYLPRSFLLLLLTPSYRDRALSIN
jgi:hypothetical protein